jgi:hypothetical protein
LVDGKLLQGPGNDLLTVISVELDRSPRRVYNLEVSNLHSFAVGELGEWVHNGFRGDKWGSLYGLYDKAGNFIRWGVTNDLARRLKEHKKTYGDCRIREVDSGPGWKMLERERWLERFGAGPGNRTGWAGTGGRGLN